VLILRRIFRLVRFVDNIRIGGGFGRVRREVEHQRRTLVSLGAILATLGLFGHGKREWNNSS